MNKKGIKSLALPAVLLRCFAMGLQSAVTNVFIIDIAASFGLEPAEIGGMVASNFAAGAIIPIIAGRAGDVLGKKKIILISTALSVLGALITAISESVGAYIAGTVIMGIGSNASNSTLSPALADVYREAGMADKYISLSHVVSGAAGMLGPIVFALMGEKLGLGWRAAFAILGILSAVTLALTALSTIPDEKGENTAEGIGGVLSLIKDPGLIIAALAMLFYCATDDVYYSLLSLIFELKYGARLYASYAMTLHSAMYAVSRFIAGYVTENGKKRVFGVVTLLISAMALILAAFSNKPWLTVVFLSLYSFSFGPAFSMLVSSVSVDYSGNSGTATSFMFLGGGFGGLLFSAPASAAAGKYGTGALLGMLAVTAVITAVFFGAYYRRVAKRDNIC